MRALIVDPRSARATLAAARALAHAGWSVGVGGMDPKCLAISSRSCRWWDRVPPPEEGLDRFATAVEDAVRGRRYAVVFPSGDAEALALSSARSYISARVPYAADAVVVSAFDKHWLMGAAAEAGIPVPMTMLVGRGSQPPPLSPPTMVKERIHAGAHRPDAQRLEAMLATTQGEAAARVREIHANGSDAILQEVVRGRLIAFAAVTGHDGKVVRAVQQEAERIFPTEAGASVRARTVPPDPDMAQRSARLLRAMRWTGLAQLQFLHEEGGTPKLIDFNGRFYGSLGLAVAAGANLPALWAAVATGRPAGPLAPVRTGVRYQWLEGDLRVATAAHRGDLVRGVLDCLRYARGAEHAIWSPADPLPQLRDGVRLLRQEVPNLHRLVRKTIR
jgi:predicted ATP-grasp superfamily ATP-dependent carboligase